MYCPVCFQDTMKIRSQGVIKLAFNGKSKNTSLFTYNLQKETQEQLEAKLRDKVVEFFSFYSELTHKTPIKYFEAYSSDFVCLEGCSISIATKISMIEVLFPIGMIEKMLKEEGAKFGIIVDIKLQS